MIFPFLRGLVAPALAPVTYFLLALNLLVFGATYEQFVRSDAKLDSLLEDDVFLETQGWAFADMIRAEPEHFNSTLVRMASQSLQGGSEMRRLLGSFAMRNNRFMSRALEYEFVGDDVALAKWRERFEEFKALQDQHPSYLWGVSHVHNDWLQWMSYQFAHSGLSHLFWNMVFLVLFGSFVEMRLGSSFVALTYVGGGLLGAYAFSLMSGISSSPLVGASAAVSGLMGLVAFTWFRKRSLKFAFMLLPMQGYYGIALLPGWTVLVVSILPDVSGFLASSADFGSVAHSAHIGGTAFGAVMAFLFARGWLVREVEDVEPDSGSDSDASKIDDRRAS